MRKIINWFQDTIRAHCIGLDATHTDSLPYWQNKLFSNVVEFLIPFSLITLIPGVIYSLMVDLPMLAFFDVLSFSILVYVGIGKGIRKVATRKLLFLLCAYFASLYLLVYIGVKGPGFLFLLSTAIFGIMIFPTRYAYHFSWVNLLICGLFTLVVHFNLSPVPEVNDIPVLEWIAISANLVFLSFVTSALFPVLFTGLSTSFEKQKDLRDALIQKKDSLEIALTELREKNNELEQFANVTSHDLQEPLRTISGMLSLLEKKYQPLLDEQGRRYITLSVDGAAKMQRFIKDLLEFSRVGRTDDQMEEVDLISMVGEVCQLQQQLIDEKKAEIKMDTLPAVRSYRTPLRQLFLNLIGNALKYTRDGVTPVIKISCESKHDSWQISISDNGIGIKKEDFGKIFVIFQRLHNEKEFKGTGIGLAAARKIVELLGGRIWVESEVGVGSTFYFTLAKTTTR